MNVTLVCTGALVCTGELVCTFWDAGDSKPSPVHWHPA